MSRGLEASLDEIDQLKAVLDVHTGTGGGCLALGDGHQDEGDVRRKPVVREPLPHAVVGSGHGATGDAAKRLVRDAGRRQAGLKPVPVLHLHHVLGRAIQVGSREHREL